MQKNKKQHHRKDHRCKIKTFLNLYLFIISIVIFTSINISMIYGIEKDTKKLSNSNIDTIYINTKVDNANRYEGEKANITSNKNDVMQIVSKNDIIKIVSNNDAMQVISSNDTIEYVSTKKSKIYLSNLVKVDYSQRENDKNRFEYAIEIKSNEKETTVSNNQENAKYSISNADKLLLEKLVFAESGICNESEQQAVATVVLERSKVRNQSISEVIFAPGQFNTAKNGKIYNNDTEVTVKMAKKVEEPVERAIAGGSGEMTQILSNIAISKGLDTKKYGGEPLYFYEQTACSEKAIRDRENVAVKSKLDKMIFYRAW